MTRQKAMVSSGATTRAALRLSRFRTSKHGQRVWEEQRWASLVAEHPEIPESELARLWRRANVIFALGLPVGPSDSPPFRAGPQVHESSIEREE